MSMVHCHTVPGDWFRAEPMRRMRHLLQPASFCDSVALGCGAGTPEADMLLLRVSWFVFVWASGLQVARPPPP